MSLRSGAIVAFATFIAAHPAPAADGQILIGQAKALAGNVTPGDAPGFPVTLTRTGSYKLIGNLDIPPGLNGIEANAVEATIDLNGFRIDGKGRATAGDCIVGNQRNLTVRNGTVMRCNRGIYFKGGNIASELRIAENEYGIRVENTTAAIKNNTFIANVNGVFCADSSTGCLIENNLIRGFQRTGVSYGAFVADGSTLIGNMISNHGAGVYSLGPSVALGDNNLGGNGIAVDGAYRPLHPNSCGNTTC